MSPKAADVAPMFHAATTTFFCAMRENDLTLVKPTEGQDWPGDNQVTWLMNAASERTCYHGHEREVQDRIDT
jgi:hypothetical protein